MEKIYKVVITAAARKSLLDIVNHIRKHSPAAAIKVRKGLTEVVKSLKESPERFSKEKFLSGKKGNYRSVVRWHYKVVYKILEDKVAILQFIHTSRSTEVITKLDD